MSDNPSRLESFPNELLLDLFGYVNIQDLYHGFWKLNSRFNYLLGSLNNLSLVIEKSNPSVTTLFARQIIRLVICTSENIDLSQFSNLRSFTFGNVVSNRPELIRRELMPNLVYLSLPFSFISHRSPQFVSDVFSNGFPFLRHANLGHCVELKTHSWFQSPCLRSVSIVGKEWFIIPRILTSCPHLASLRVHILGGRIVDPSPSSSSVNIHPLKRFVLLDMWHEFSFDNLDTLFAYVPNVKWIDLGFFCEEPFIHLAHILANRLPHLSRFDCHITELLNGNEIVDDIDIIRQIHPCFNQIEDRINDGGYRVLTANKIKMWK